LQQGDPKAALQGWVDLEADSPSDAEWLPLVRQRIAEAAAVQGMDPAALRTSRGTDRPAGTAAPQSAGAGPSPEAVASAAAASADASAEERRAMIDGMVERLAARLEQQPDDVEGWARLGRSYMVLQQPDKAREAYARAVTLKPGDAALRQALAEATQAVQANPGQANPAPAGDERAGARPQP
jgi:cytochrome c-type biogenesis protein CcmH